MGLRGWLHVLAAFLGVALAALIVFLVFGNASDQNQIEGDAPGEQSATSLCGSVDASTVTERKVIDQASTNLPKVYNNKGKAIEPSDSKQRLWLATLHAASGLCLTEIRVLPQQLRLKAGYPDSMSATQVDAFVYATLSRSFEGPPSLRFRSLSHEAVVDGQTRSVRISADTWGNFRRARAAMALDRSVRDLKAFKRQGYSDAELFLRGW
jgi:hypothetical protein